MDKLSKALVFIAVVCLFLAGCGTAAQSTTSPTLEFAPTTTPIVAAGAGNTSVITPDMKDKTLNLKVGDTFEVQIPTIPTAGMNWEAQDLDTTILSQLGDPVYTADTAPNSAGGIVAIKFKVVGAGTTPLNLIYAAPAQNGLPSLSNNSFGVTIIAK